MARKNINLGTNANDGTGDKLRDAMSKVNDNLIELYTRTGGDATLSNVGVSFAGNTITANTNISITTNDNGTLTIDAAVIASHNLVIPESKLSINTSTIETENVLLVNGNAKIKGNTTLGDNISEDAIILNSTISNTIIPTVTLTYDIGTTNNKYRDMYIGGISYLDNLNSQNATITGGTINGTAIGDSNPVEGRFLNLRVLDDTFLGNLLVRDNIISTGINDEDIEIRPFGNGNLQVATKIIVGEVNNPIGDAIFKAIDTVQDSYVQVVFQNLDNGSMSTTDLFMPRDDGDDLDNFINLGINSSTYEDVVEFPIHTPGSAYLYTSNADIFIGTYSNNDLVLHAGNASFSSIAMRIKGDTSHIIIGPEDGSTIVVDTGETLQVNGDARVNGNLIVQGRTITSSIGIAGDTVGMIAVDSSYLYYCTANYDGSTSIWSRVALSSTPW